MFPRFPWSKALVWSSFSEISETPTQSPTGPLQAATWSRSRNQLRVFQRVAFNEVRRKISAMYIGANLQQQETKPSAIKLLTHSPQTCRLAKPFPKICYSLLLARKSVTRYEFKNDRSPEWSQFTKQKIEENSRLIENP